MFGYMSDSQIATFILGIVFTVLSIVSAFVIHKYSKTSKLGKSIGFALIAPFIAFTSWLFLIFSYLDGFRNDELINLLVSIVIAAVICGMLVIVARALYNKHQDMFDAEDNEKLENVTDSDANDGDNQVQNKSNTTKAIVAPLMIEHVQNEQNEAIPEELQVDENEAHAAGDADETEIYDENDAAEDEVASEVDADEKVADESVEEVSEGNLDDDTTETEEVEDEQPDTDEFDEEDLMGEEDAAVDDNSEEPVNDDEIDDNEVDVDEMVEEDEPAAEQEGNNRPLTPEEEDDAEFEKFLEALRQKAELEKNNKKTDEADDEE